MDKIQQLLTQEFNFKQDEASHSLCGVYNGYNMLLSRDSQSSIWHIIVSVENGGAPDQNILKEEWKAMDALRSVTVSGYRVSTDVKARIGRDLEQTTRDALEQLSGYLQRNHFNNCCESTGSKENVGFYCVNGSMHLMSQPVFQAAVDSLQDRQTAYKQKKNNLIGGLVGALLGAAVGAAVIVLISQLGYVAVVSGLIMGVLTVKGFELFGGKMNWFTLLLLLALMGGMVYVAHRVDWAIALSKQVSLPILDSFRVIEEAVKDVGAMNKYYTELGKHMIFALLGAVPVAISTLTDRKAPVKAYQVNV